MDEGFTLEQAKGYIVRALRQAAQSVEDGETDIPHQLRAVDVVLPVQLIDFETGNYIHGLVYFSVTRNEEERDERWNVLMAALKHDTQQR